MCCQDFKHVDSRNSKHVGGSMRAFVPSQSSRYTSPRTFKVRLLRRPDPAFTYTGSITILWLSVKDHCFSRSFPHLLCARHLPVLQCQSLSSRLLLVSLTRTEGSCASAEYLDRFILPSVLSIVWSFVDIFRSWSIIPDFLNSQDELGAGNFSTVGTQVRASYLWQDSSISYTSSHT